MKPTRRTLVRVLAALGGLLIVQLGFLAAALYWNVGPLASRASCAESVSGAAEPMGDIPGWHKVFGDHFSGQSLDASKWTAYSGPTSGDPIGWWDQSHAVVDHCSLTLKGYEDAAVKRGVVTTAGIGMRPAYAQTYGKYLVRMRVGRGDGISAIALLWPDASVWPPEVDFFEDAGGDRTDTSATLHCGSMADDMCRVQKSLDGYDFTRWHTVGVEWTKGKLAYTIDDLTWATVVDSRVPTIPMWLAIQSQALECSPYNTCVSSRTPREVDMQIAWVVTYSPQRLANLLLAEPFGSSALEQNGRL
jgi:beta-glucanase (GH16 family)